VTKEIIKITGVITSVEQIYSLAEMKKSVRVDRIGRLPAAIVINWQGALLIRLIRQQKITVYEKKQINESRYIL